MTVQVAQARTRKVANLLDADPDLAAGLDSPRALLARRSAGAEVVALEPGSSSLPGAEPLGLLVLDGLVSRELVLGDRRSIELLGRGDVIRPGEPDSDQYEMVPMETRWTVLEATEVALLDERFARSMAPYPEVFGALLSRAVARSRRLSLCLAIAQLPKLTARLHFLLWHLADRFGRVEPEGVVLPLRLSHEALAGLVCAQRPSVTHALAELQARRLVARLPNGDWRLGAGPPVCVAPAKRLREPCPVNGGNGAADVRRLTGMAGRT